MEVYVVSHDPFWLRRQIKERERNIPSAMLCIVVISTLATALALPRWFVLKGGGCSQKYIGVHDFFTMGHFETQQYSGIEPSPTATVYYISGTVGLRDCVTPGIVRMLRLNIGLVIVAILASLLQFSLDTLGVRHTCLRTVRRNALGSILTVLFCASCIGASYYISTLMEIQQESSKKNPGTKVEVKFDISYYLVTAAGAVAILATSANLLKKYPPQEDNSEENLLDDYDGNETFSVGGTQCQMWPCRRLPSSPPSLPPPPPYSP